MVGRWLVLLAVTAELSASSAVYMMPPKVFSGTPRDNLPGRCAVTSPVHACTMFERPILTTHCRKEEEWLLDATLQLQPTVILTRTSFFAHEMVHLRDIEERLQAYLRTLVAPRFATRDQCLQAAGAAIYSFPATFERVKGESNLRLDHFREPGRRVAAAQ
jgi:hypothetical protein